MAMLRRGFTFVTAVTMMAAAAIACSSSGGGGDAPAASSTTPPKPPPLPPTPPDPPNPPPPVTCPPPDLQAVTAADIDKQVGYKPAVVSASACTAAEITTFDTNSSDSSIKSFFDLGKNLSDTCKSCIIAKDTDANWAPIVGTAKDNGASGFYDFGACFGAVEGDACGKAIQYSEFCFNIACNKCSNGDAKARDACVKIAGAKGGFCEAFEAQVASACPNLSTTQTTCGNIVDAAKYLCTGAGADAGGG